MKKKYGIEAATYFDNKIYYFSMDYNGLFMLDLNNGEQSFLTSVPGYGLGEERLFRKLICYNDKLFLIPLRASKVFVYDLIQNRFVKDIELSNYLHMIDEYCIETSTLYMNYIIMFPCVGTEILVLNLDDYSVSVKDEWKEEYEKKYSSIKEKRHIYENNVLIKDNVLYVLLGFTNAILCLELTTYNYSIVKVGRDEDRYFGLSSDGKLITFASRTSDFCLIRLDLETMDTDVAYNASIEKDYRYASPVWINHRLYLIPFDDREILEIDATLNVKNRLAQKGHMLYRECLLNNVFCASFLSDGTITLFDLNMNNIHEYCVRLDSNYRKQALRDVFDSSQKDIFVEQKRATLEDFLEWIS